MSNLNQNLNVIYKIENVADGKCYIGKTVDFDSRMRNHERADGGTPYLHAAIKKYNWICFSKEVIHSNIPDEFVRFVEDMYIAYFDSLVPNGYNLKYNYNYEDGFSVPEIVDSISDFVIHFVIYSIRKYNLYDHDKIYLMVFNELINKGYDTADVRKTINSLTKLLESIRKS